MKFKQLVLVSLLLSGCAGSPEAIKAMSSEQLQNPKVTDAQLLGTLQWFHLRSPDEEVLAEAQRRGLLTDREISHIKNHTIFVGMSGYALVAVLGWPSHTTSFSDGTTIISFGRNSRFIVTMRESKPDIFRDQRLIVVSWIESS